MRAHLVISCILALPAALAAQTLSQNEFRKWDRTTEFTSRAALGQEKGQISQAFAYGFTAELKTLTNAQYVIQDQNLATREPWDASIAELGEKCLPDYANLKHYATNNLLPAGNGIGAFLITHTTLSAKGIQIPQNCAQWHHVWNFQQGANWTSDGLSIHMSQAAPYNSTLRCSNGLHREIPRTEGTAQIIEELGWSSTPDPLDADPAPRNRAWRLRLNFDEVVLQGFQDNAAYNDSPCPNPNEGYASLDPDFDDSGAGTPARFDNYRWTVRAGSKFGGGFGILFWSTRVLNAPVATSYGAVHLDPLDPMVALSPLLPPLSAAGIASFDANFGPGPNALRTALGQLPCWQAQAFVVDRTLTEGRVSNLFAFRPKTVPAGYTEGSADKGGTDVPFADKKLLCVRNDGRGQLVVKVKDGNGRTLHNALVCERTCQLIDFVRVQTGTVTFQGPCSNKTEFVYTFGN